MMRLNTAPQVAPSNMPTAIATAGRIIGQTPAMRSCVSSIFCVSSARNMYSAYCSTRRTLIFERISLAISSLNSFKVTLSPESP